MQQDRGQIMDWRRAERARLLEARMRLSVAERQEASQRIADRVDDYCRSRNLLGAGRILSAYWPLKGEPDLRPWLVKLNAEGVITVMPVVVEKSAPLRFRKWTPGCEMEKGFWNIPVPDKRDRESFLSAPSLMTNWIWPRPKPLPT